MRDVLLTPMEKFIKEAMNSDELVREPPVAIDCVLLTVIALGLRNY